MNVSIIMIVNDHEIFRLITNLFSLCLLTSPPSTATIKNNERPFKPVRRGWKGVNCLLYL
jgi:hypothetical protein